MKNNLMKNRIKNPRNRRNQVNLMKAAKMTLMNWMMKFIKMKIRTKINNNKRQM
jgi:hypothetical protein